MPNDEPTLVQRIAVRAADQRAETLNTIATKLVGLMLMVVGVGMILAHQYSVQWKHAPELYLLIPSLVLIILGAAAFMPMVLNLAAAIIRELLPSKWRVG